MSAAASGPGATQGARPGGDDVSDQAYPAPVIAWTTVAVLFVAYIFSFIDRMIIGLLVEPMKADLGISDTQISLLQGFAFAIFYTFAGLPLGRLIDRSARLPIVAAGVALWSLMTALCGLTTQYWQLFLARMGVGVGEATLSPAAYSIITDSFPRRRLGLAMGVYGLGSAVGAGLAFMIGAVVINLVGTASEVVVPLLGAVKPWQFTFLIVGLPGLVIAGLVLLLPEPVRRMHKSEEGLAQVSIDATVAFVRSRAGSILGLCMAVAMVNFAVLGSVSWLPVMLIRVHDMALTDAGKLAGAALIIGGLIGLIGGGWLSDRMGGGSADSRLRFCGVAAVFGTVCGVAFPLMPSPLAVAALFTAFFAAAAVPIGAAISSLQQLTPNRMRATISALYIFIVNIIGLGVGPTATALVGDTFFPTDTGIRYAIAIVAPVGFALAAILFFYAARAARHDLAQEAAGGAAA